MSCMETTYGGVGSRCLAGRWARRVALAVAGLALAGMSGAAAKTQEKADIAAKSCVPADFLGQIRVAGKGVVVRAPEGADAGSQPGMQQSNAASAEIGLQEIQQAREAFEKGARKGDAGAQVNLAVLELSGVAGPTNGGRALYWLNEAARQGYALADFDLGVLYLSGCGVRQDYGEAARFFALGADRGNAAAQMNLGYLYDRGLGVAQDRARAAAWYRKAAEAGLAAAQFNLGDLYVHGEGVPLDEGAALGWFQRAARQGQTTAQLMLATMYEEARGTARDLPTAYAWLVAAGMSGDTRAASQMEVLEGRLTPAQVASAKAAGRGFAQAQKREAEAVALR